MGIFQDYLTQKNPHVRNVNGIMMPTAEGLAEMAQQPTQVLDGGTVVAPVAPSTTTAAPQPQAVPQVDTSNAIGSLADILGPTPAEREARERRMQENKAKMQMWAGLFDGLRQLGNLYYVAKGATPQNLASPVPMVEQQFQQQRALQDSNDAYRRQYNTSLYNLRRQISDDARRDMLAKAQADYYGTRDEVARIKAENDKLKAEKYVQLQDGRIAKINAETGQIIGLLPLKQREIESRIQKNQQMGNAAMTRANKSGGGGSRGGSRSNGTYGYKTTTYYDEQGRKVTERVPTTGGVPERRVQEPQRSNIRKGSMRKSNNNYKNTRALGL